MKQPPVLAMSLFALVLLASQTVFAEVTQYQDESSFLSAVETPDIIDFEGLVAEGDFLFLGDPGQHFEQGVTIQNNSPMFLQNNNVYGTGTFLSAQQFEPQIVIISLPADTTAVGFSYQSNAAIAALDTGEFLDLPAITAGSLGFFGVTSDTEIRSIILTISGSSMDLDNLRFVITLPDFGGGGANPPQNDGDGMNNIAGGGLLDTDFGTNGVLLFSDLAVAPETGVIAFNRLGIQPSGAMIVAGILRPDVGEQMLAIARLDETGALDPSFGVDGLTTVDVANGPEFTRDMIVLPDGSIVLAGGTFPQGEDPASYLVKLDEHGHLDDSFGSAGVSIHNLASSVRDQYDRIAVQPDGKLLAGTQGLGVNRHLANGSFDPEFGPSGQGRSFFRSSAAFGLASTSDGSAVFGGGFDLSDSSEDFDIYKFTPSGDSLDGNFGINGLTSIAVTAGNDSILDIAIDSKGRIVILGYIPNGVGVKSAVARLYPDGTPDPDFGVNGVQIVDVPNRSTRLRKIKFRPDGGILLSGEATTTGTRFELIVVSLHENGALDSGFAAQGSMDIDAVPDPQVVFTLIRYILGGLEILPNGKIAVLDPDCNCMSVFTAPDWFDNDNDGIGDQADPDDDNDGILDIDDPYPTGQFNDARPGHWAFTFIEKLGGSGITAGCGNGNYCPSDSVTRAQMAVFLERSMRGSGYSPPAATGNVFLDVGAGDFAASFIERLASDGITAGCGNNNYCPNADITRAQMAVFLLRAKYGADYSPPPPATGVFNDVPLNYWAVNWIEQLAAEGITTGCGGGNYCPETQVTRDQMAVFLVRTFGL